MQPEQNKKSVVSKTFLAIVIVGILAAAGAAYHYHFTRKSMPTTAVPSDSGSVSKSDQAAIMAALQTAGTLYKNGDIAGLKAYVTASGDGIEGLNLTGNNAEDSASKKKFYTVAFKEVLEHTLQNEQIAYDTGAFTDGTSYVEMKVSGSRDLSDPASKVTYVETFIPVNGTWYWTSFDLSPS